MDLISTTRLDLIPMTHGFLEACLSGQREAAERLLKLSIPEEWFEERELMRIRLDQLRADAALQPWLLRAIRLRSLDAMVGHIGFHSRPGAGYLQPYAPAGVEYGYTVFPFYRRQGYAREACLALMDWAYREHGVSQFVVSISPDNRASQALAAGLGFRIAGAWEDEEDGLEEVLVLEYGGKRA